MAVQISGNDITVPRDGSFTRNVTIGGTLTYEDVTNIDSVGLVTARQGIEIGASPGVGASISVDGKAEFAGIVTASSFVGSGANLTGVASTENIRTNTNATFLQNISVVGTSTVTGNIVPSSDSATDIGTNSVRFQNAYVDTYYGSGANLTGIDSDKISEGNTEVETIDTGSDGHVKITTEGSERFRINNIGIMTSYYSGNRGGISLLGAFQAEVVSNATEGIIPAVTTDTIHCFDACGWYDNTNFWYKPQVKGHYMFNLSGQFGTDMNGSSIEQSFSFYLNGSAVSQYADGYSTNYGNYYFTQMTQMVFCNGTTDYVQAWMNSNRTPQIFSTTKWSGYLIHPVA